MAKAPCESEMAPSAARASRILFLSELATCCAECRFCICIVDILSETMSTLWRQASSCTSLKAIYTAFSSAW